ncbi:YciI family protein [Nocardia australiensis]|uniref:YciI family protein n=1 Tax=Nocardia australiensis TaxID=2887191 RepID=UPI001D140CD6|nr:YciI family protein [Nocardia australiensis]
MKYMILSYGSQQDYDGLVGKETGKPAWTADEFTAVVEFMGELNKRLEQSGELVGTGGLAEPVHTRRITTRDGAPFVTDGPYAETQEVLAGYWIVECESFDRATEIAAELSKCPGPAHVVETAYADVRPIHGSAPEFG